MNTSAFVKILFSFLLVALASGAHLRGESQETGHASRHLKAGMGGFGGGFKGGAKKAGPMAGFKGGAKMYGPGKAKMYGRPKMSPKTMTGARPKMSAMKSKFAGNSNMYGKKRGFGMKRV